MSDRELTRMEELIRHAQHLRERSREVIARARGSLERSHGLLKSRRVENAELERAGDSRVTVER